jgi:peroxiredoxin
VYTELREAGGDVLVVSFSAPTRVAAYLERYPQPFAVVSDPERSAYRTFALDQTSWGSFLRPGVLWGYLKLMFGGWSPQAAGKGDDVLQLGGDFVIDREGKLAWAYRSKVATDRPPTSALVEAIRHASDRGAGKEG